MWIKEAGEFEGFWPGAPDLAVEVISPGDSGCTGSPPGPAWCY